MTFGTGSILFVKDYQLPTKVKDKFFIVVAATEQNITLMSMATSQIYFDYSHIKHGIIKDRELSVYCFPKGKVIGQNGFSFNKDTIVSHRWNVHEFSVKQLIALNIEYKDCLIKEEIVNLIYSFYSYSGTLKKHKQLFEKILFELTNKIE